LRVFTNTEKELTMAYAFTGTIRTAPIEERLGNPSLLSRIIASMTESRMRAVRRELAARGYLTGETSLILGDTSKTTLASDARLPFAR
jgi:hypothetical protein